MADDVVTVAEFGQFVARMDERFDFMQHDIKELRSEMRSQRVLMMAIFGPLVVSLSLAIVGAVAKFLLFM